MTYRGIFAEALNRKRFILVLTIAAFALALVAFTDESQPKQLTFVDNISWNADGVVACSAAGTDSAAYSLSGYKLPATATTYKINTNTIPTGLVKTDVQNAIIAAFTTVDGATSKALFT